MHTREVIEKIERGEYPKNMTLPIIEVGGIEHKFCRSCRTYLTIDKFYQHGCWCIDCYRSHAREVWASTMKKPAGPDHPCASCHSYSRQPSNMTVNVGFCMKWRKAVDGKRDTCGAWREEVKRNFVKVIGRE